MTTAIVRRQEIGSDIWQTIMQVAPVMKDSRLFGVSTEAQAAAIMAKGYELGLSLTAAFEFISVIKDRPTLSPRGALALVLQSGLLESMKIEDLKDQAGQPASCRVTMKRTGGFEYSLEFSMADAQRAGLVKKDGAWEAFPANMLRWRTVGYVIDVVFPDATGGMKRSDEFGANLDNSGNVIEGQWTPAPAATVLNTTPAITLAGLVEAHGAERVMEANGGRIPGTQAEVDALATVLA